MTDEEKKRGIKIKGLGIKVEKDKRKTRKIKIKDFKGMKITVERETDPKLTEIPSSGQDDLSIQSLSEFEIKEKKAPSIKISKFNKLTVKDKYKPLTKSSFQSLMELISGKIYNSLNFINSLFEFYTFCKAKRNHDEVISVLNDLANEAKNSFPDLDMTLKINNLTKSLHEFEQEECSFRSSFDLQYNAINWCHEILKFGENNAKLYMNSKTVGTSSEIVKKIEWSLSTIESNLLNIENQYFSDILTHLMVIYKTNGIVLIANSFIEEEMGSGDLIGGFLTAIQSFGIEISKRDTPMKRLKYEDFEIEIKDGDFVRIALILQGEPIPLVDKQINDFCKKFESKYYSDLSDFSGDITKFQEETPEIIKGIFP